MKGCITMSNKELDRSRIIERVIVKRLTQPEAAIFLNLSIIRVKRLCLSFRLFGHKGLISKKRNNSRYQDHRADKEVKLPLGCFSSKHSMT